jgi:hypothetical protein
MQKPKQNIKQPAVVFIATCAMLLVIITLFRIYSMRQIKKYDTHNTHTPPTAASGDRVAP